MSRPPCVPNPENCSLEELTQAGRSAVSLRSHIRLTAIKALLLGAQRAFVCELYQVDERTLRRWIIAFNAQGIDGLIESGRPGRPRVIKQEQALYYRQILQEPERAGHTHWTAVKFHGWLSEQMQAEVGYSTVVRFQHEQGFRLKVPQPWPDRQDPKAREAFCQSLKTLTQDQEVELWFCDETGIEGDPKPRRRWAQKGSKPRVVKNGDHLRMNVTGLICPRTGEALLLEFSHSDREVFQAFLDEANKHLQLRRTRQILILDNASWHHARNLKWGRFEPLYLPAYSPDLNPIERLWLLIKQEWFNNFVAKDRDHLIERLDEALRWAMRRQDLNRQTCSIRTEL